MTERRTAPDPAPWGGCLVLDALLYVACALLVKRDFLPWGGVHVLDTRWSACSNVDKLDELQSSLHVPAALGQTVADFAGGHGATALSQDFNPVPKLLIWAAAQVIEPILAYNLVALALWAGTGLAVAALVLQLARSRAAALLAGFLFAFSPHWISVLHCRSLDYALFLPLPLALCLLVSTRRRRTWAAPLASAALAVLLVLSQQYYALGLALIGLVWSAFAWVQGPEAADAPSRAGLAGRLLAAGALALLVLSPWLLLEWRLLQVGVEAMERGGYDAGRSFFQPIHVSSREQPGLGVAWTALAAVLSLVGLIFGSRSARVERWAFAATAVGLLLAQHGIATHASAVARVLWSLPVVWRMRACTLSATLVVFLGASLAGIGFAALIERSKRFWTRVVFALPVLAACLAFVQEGDRWWKNLCNAGATAVWFPEPVLASLRTREPRPLLAVPIGEGLGPGTEHFVKAYLELRTGLPSADSGQEQHLRRLLLDEDSAVEPAPPCALLALPGSWASESAGQASARLARVGSTETLHQDSAWTLVLTGTCSPRLR